MWEGRQLSIPALGTFLLCVHAVPTTPFRRFGRYHPSTCLSDSCSPLLGKNARRAKRSKRRDDPVGHDGRRTTGLRSEPKEA
jgi:hypothetical protein